MFNSQSSKAGDQTSQTQSERLQTKRENTIPFDDNKTTLAYVGVWYRLAE